MKCDKTGCKSTDASYVALTIGDRTVSLCVVHEVVWDNDEEVRQLAHKSARCRIAIDANTYAGNVPEALSWADKLFAQETENRAFIDRWLKTSTVGLALVRSAPNTVENT